MKRYANIKILWLFVRFKANFHTKAAAIGNSTSLINMYTTQIDSDGIRVSTVTLIILGVSDLFLYSLHAP